jgi:DNA-binding PadR family transcriptional regulator
MLTQQLRELEADGIVERRVYATVPPKVEYSLTEYGLSLKRALRALCDWGRDHMERIGAIELAPQRAGVTDADPVKSPRARTRVSKPANPTVASSRATTAAR